MSLRKWCGPTFAADHPLHCQKSPACEHHWFYDFRVNRKRYRSTTETANKQEAKKIEANERSRILAGRHGIREQPDITFRAFAEDYIRDHAELHKRSVSRDREILKVLNRAFGSLILHEITAHRIEQFKRERLAGKWRGHLHKGNPKPLRPGTVNRELDTLRGIFSKAVEWGKLLEHPMRSVKRLKVDNRRSRILTEAEQAAVLKACPKKMARLVRLALITGARVGELLALRWEDVTDAEITFLETKNGRARRIPVSAAMKAVLEQCPKSASGFVFTNPRTHKGYTVNGVAHVFRRALTRAGIKTGDVSLHTLRHTALSRMIAMGIDDFTVMALSGHRSIRMLERYTHPTNARKIDALARSRTSMGRIWAERKKRERKVLVDGRRLELPTSALRTRRSPN
jgi:integrase